MLELDMTKKNEKPAKKSAKEMDGKKVGQGIDPDKPLQVSITLNPADACAVRQLGEKNGEDFNRAFWKILESGIHSARELANLPGWRPANHAERRAAFDRKMQVRDKARPKIMKRCMAVDDDGEELTVRITGEVYENLRKAAKALSATFGDTVTPWEVFRECALIEDAVLFPDELADVVCEVERFGVAIGSPEISEVRDELQANLEKVGLR